MGASSAFCDRAAFFRLTATRGIPISFSSTRGEIEMVQKATTFGQMVILWSCAGIGFNLTQRLMDHFIDGLVDQHAWLAWLK